MSDTTIFPEGTLVKVTKENASLDDSHLRVDQLLEVEFFVSAEESEDGVAFYGANKPNFGGFVAVSPDAIEQHMTPEEVANRKPPSTQAIRELVASGVMRMYDEGYDKEAELSFTVDETNWDGEAAMEVYGETEQGLRFGFRVTIGDVWQTDF